MQAVTTARRQPSMESGAVGDMVSGVEEWMDFLNSLESLLASAEPLAASGSDSPSPLSQAQLLVRDKRKQLRKRLLEGSQRTAITATDSAAESLSVDLEPLEVGSTKSVYTTNIDVDMLGSFDSSLAVKNAREGNGSQSFVDAFRQIALQMSPTPEERSISPQARARRSSLESASSTFTSVFASSSLLQETRMHCFQRSFPVWRKLFVYSTQSRKLLPSKARDSSRRMSSAISPKMTHFALCSCSFYFIYRVPLDLNDPPELLHQGPVESENEDTHYFISMNEQWAAFASVSGHIFVVSISTGNILHSETIKFNIQSLHVSVKGSFVVYSILSTNKITLQRQPMVCIMCPNVVAGQEDAFSHVDTVTFTSPYTDLIKTIKVSPDESFLMCGTDTESRLFGVSLLDPRQPRILLRSSRKASDDAEYEGITDIEFFDDSRSLIVASVAQGCPPVIFDTKIANGQRRGSSSSHSTANIPSVVMRIDKIGSNIHRASASPTGRAAAFVDKSGVVYILSSSRVATEPRKVTVCFDVANSRTKFKAASIQWSPDGTVLIAVDRKGVFQAADFGAGLPGSSGVSKVRVLS